jgi:hypothetical protein
VAVSGVTYSSGAKVTSAAEAFLARLRASVPASVRINVNSGVRSPDAQAAALVTKRAQAGDAGVRALYGQKDLVNELLAVPNDRAAMRAVLEAQVSRGRFLSRHMRSDALDIRSRDLSTEQQAAIVSAALALGAKAFVERDPPHIHIENIGGLQTQISSALAPVTSTLAASSSAAIIAAGGAARKTGKRAKRAAELARRNKGKIALGLGGGFLLALVGVLLLARRARSTPT